MDTMDINLGFLLPKKQLVTLPWDNIGLLVVGRPGSGKSHVIATLLTQYALKGADIVVAEYNADPSNTQSLLYRIRHLEHALARPAVTSGDDIVALIKWVKQELEARQHGKSARTPLIVVIDEFFQFAASVKPPDEVNVKKSGDARTDEGETIIKQKAPSFWEDLLASQTDMRKNNIRLIIAAQETSSTATSNLMRQVRDMFRFKLIMNLSPKGADLLDIKTTKDQQVINNLKSGQIWTNGRIITVPFPIKQQWLDKCAERLQPRQHIQPIKEDWNDEDTRAYIAELFAMEPKLYTVKDHKIWYVQTREDVIEYLVLSGWTNNAIRELIKGRMVDTDKTVNAFRDKHNIRL